jgi:hypothetical protein
LSNRTDIVATAIVTNVAGSNIDIQWLAKCMHACIAKQGITVTMHEAHETHNGGGVIRIFGHG